MKTAKEWLKERCVPEGPLWDAQPTWADWIKAIQDDATATLRTQLKSVEAERDRYRVALNRLLIGDHVGTPINRGCGAMSVIEDALSWTDAEVEQFMKEWDEGKHQLSPEDEKALEDSKAKLFARIKSTLNPKPQDVK